MQRHATLLMSQQAAEQDRAVKVFQPSSKSFLLCSPSGLFFLSTSFGLSLLFRSPPVHGFDLSPPSGLLLFFPLPGQTLLFSPLPCQPLFFSTLLSLALLLFPLPLHPLFFPLPAQPLLLLSTLLGKPLLFCLLCSPCLFFMLGFSGFSCWVPGTVQSASPLPDGRVTSVSICEPAASSAHSSEVTRQPVSAETAHL